MRRGRLVGTILFLISISCIDQLGPSSDLVPVSCSYGRVVNVELIPSCLTLRGIISSLDSQRAIAILEDAVALHDSVRQDTGQANFYRSAEIIRAFVRVTDLYSRRLFEDSARFNRMLDVIRVTAAAVRGAGIRWANGRAWPDATPYLSWLAPANTGYHFQPVNTVQSLFWPLPPGRAPTDSLLAMGELFYRYALWREVDGHRFPIWEYTVNWNSGGVALPAPWISGLGQAYAIMLFAECFKRTGDPVWRVRALEAMGSYYVLWDDGGVLVSDTTHGYWWEEWHPTVRILNGAAYAVLAVGYLWKVSGDSEAKRLFDRGVEALKYYIPEYDTGSWTLYSRTQGLVSVGYHQTHILQMDALYQYTGDQFFKETADRWRTYQPPATVALTSTESLRH